MSRGCGASVRSPYHSIVPRVGDVPPPPSSMLGCDTIEIDQAVLIAAKVTMTATMMVSLFVIDMGCSRGFHQTETASADSVDSTLSRSRQVVMDRTGKMKIVTVAAISSPDERHSYGLYTSALRAISACISPFAAEPRPHRPGGLLRLVATAAAAGVTQKALNACSVKGPLPQLKFRGPVGPPGVLELVPSAR
jgi:hypothetical protein